MQIQYYGIVETIGGALKCILVLGVSILLYVIAAKGMQAFCQFLSNANPPIEHDGDSSGRMPHHTHRDRTSANTT
jgi:hypothetical protein